MPERLFGMIIGGRYTRMSEKSEERSLFGAYKISSEGFGGFEPKGQFADGMELSNKSFFDLGRPLAGDMAGFKLLPCVAELRAEVDEAVAEEVGGGVLVGFGQERMFGFDVLSFWEEE